MGVTGRRSQQTEVMGMSISDSFAGQCGQAAPSMPSSRSSSLPALVPFGPRGGGSSSLLQTWGAAVSLWFFCTLPTPLY